MKWGGGGEAFYDRFTFLVCVSCQLQYGTTFDTDQYSNLNFNSNQTITTVTWIRSIAYQWTVKLLQCRNAGILTSCSLDAWRPYIDKYSERYSEVIYPETTQRVTCSHNYCCSHGYTVEYVLECVSLKVIATHRTHYSVSYRLVAVYLFFLLWNLWSAPSNDPLTLLYELPGSQYTRLSQCKLLQYFIHTLQRFQITQQFCWNSVPSYTCRCLNTTSTSWTLNIKHKSTNHVAWKGIKAD